MATKKIIKLIERGDIAKNLKSAFKFMLLSRGFTADEVKILDGYDFFVRRRDSSESAATEQVHQQVRHTTNVTIHYIHLTAKNLLRKED